MEFLIGEAIKFSVDLSHHPYFHFVIKCDIPPLKQPTRDTEEREFAVTSIFKTQDGIAAEGPDFLCIGMGKAGTGWLYDQCAHHPDFWMPPIKEIHYLDREQPNLRAARRSLRRRDKEKYLQPEDPPGRKRGKGKSVS